ncbi:S49 family peptidase [Aerococcus urinae]|uniref:S49 family peptidase n=1 Tax=Aerococcus urinae TaxID=1376 RepID=UPI00227D3E84|nr:S49 family peptidase [Aerococcus urinae]MCY3050953.1 S49 family peptidase [Aerococcus urinae]
MSFINALIEGLVVVLVIISVIFILGLLIYKKIKQSSSKEEKMTKSVREVVIDCEDIQEDQVKFALSSSSSDSSYFDFLSKLADLAEDPQIERVYIDLDKLDLSSAQIEEVRPIFEEMGKNKEVIAYGAVFDKRTYLMALLASKIYLLDTNNAGLFFRGYQFQELYLSDFLKKLGVRVNVLSIGDYKDAGESLKQNQMSDFKRQSLQKLGDQSLSYFLNFVKAKRNVDIEKELLEGEFILSNRQQALDKGLIDGYISYADLVSNDDTKKVSFETYEPMNKQKDGPVLDTLKKYRKGKNSQSELAVICLSGEIQSRESKGSYISYANVKKKVDQIKEMDQLSGIILRIDSPGGSALEAEKIYQMLSHLDLPIYVSMANYCASGGYYIACAGDRLFADKITLTGSIGVVGLIPEFSGTLEKLSIHPESVSKGQGVDFFDFTSPVSNWSKDRLINHMMEVYQEFKERVSKARKLSEDEVEALAGGRVYLGEEAQTKGLVYEIGSLNECIEALSQKLGLDDPKITYIQEKIDSQELLKQMKLSMPKASLEATIQEYLPLDMDIQLYEAVRRKDL